MNQDLADLLAETIGIDVSAVSAETSRDSAEQWDSMNHLRLITALEESYSIRLSMEEIENIKSFADLESVVQQHT